MRYFHGVLVLLLFLGSVFYSYQAAFAKAPKWTYPDAGYIFMKDSTGTDTILIIKGRVFIKPYTNHTGNLGYPSSRMQSINIDTARIGNAYPDTLGGTIRLRFGTAILPDTSVGKGRTVGDPTHRVEIHADTITANYFVSAAGAVDSNDIKTPGVSYSNLNPLSVDSTKIRAISVSSANLRPLAVDSNKVRAGSIAGSNLASTLGGVRLTLPQGLTVNDSLIVPSANFRVGTTGLFCNTTDVGIGVNTPAFGTIGTWYGVTGNGLHIKTTGTGFAGLAIENTNTSRANGIQLVRNGTTYSALILEQDAGNGASSGSGPFSTVLTSIGTKLLHLGFNNSIKATINTNGMSIGDTLGVGSEKLSIKVADDGVGITYKVNATQANASGTVLDVRSTTGSEGGITLADGGAITYGGFTGTHNAQKGDEAEAIEVGMIVSATGNMMQEGGKAIHPMIRKSSGRGDKAVYGTLMGLVAKGVPADSVTLYKAYLNKKILRDAGDTLVVVPKKPFDEKGRSVNFSDGDQTKNTYQVASVGVGEILVTDTGGDIENGDLISPSPVNGYGERQTVGFDGKTYDMFAKDTTVAKSVVCVKWDDVTVDPVAGIKRKLIPCTYK